MQQRSWNEFVDNFISAFNRIVPLESFFADQLESVNTTSVFNSYYSKNIPLRSIQNYINHMCLLDPINALHQHKNTIVHLKNQNIPESYHHFLKDNQILDNIELVFKTDNIAYFGISLIRSKNETAFSAQEIQIIQSCYDLA